MSYKNYEKIMLNFGSILCKGQNGHCNKEKYTSLPEDANVKVHHDF